MPQRLIIALLGAALIAYACGPRTRASEARRSDRVMSGLPVAPSLSVRVSDGVAFSFVVTNNASRKLELSFPSGQTHDLVVLDYAGRELWRWSDGGLFTQAMQNTVLEGAQALNYRARWKPAASLHGEFLAVATLMSENHPLEQRVTPRARLSRTRPRATA